MEDLRSQISLIAAVLALTLAVSVLLRTPRQRVHYSFTTFAFGVGAWYLSAALLRTFNDPIYIRINLLCALVVPITALLFFRVFVDARSLWLEALERLSWLFAVVVGGVIALTPYYDHIVVSIAIFVYVIVLLASPLVVIYARGRLALSRFEGARLRYLALVGALAGLFTIIDYLPYVGVELPPVGPVLALIFLYAISQSVVLYRLLDLYEVAGRLAVFTVLAFTLALLFLATVRLSGGKFFLPSVAAAMVILLVFDPVRAKVEERIAEFFFRERYDLERSVADIRRHVARLIHISDVTRVVIDGIEHTRRATHASIYFIDRAERGFELVEHFGPRPITRIDVAPARPLFDQLITEGVVTLENIERAKVEPVDLGSGKDAEAAEIIIESMNALHASVCVAIYGGSSRVIGFFCIRDERLRDAYSPEEIELWQGLATQISIAVDNSQIFRRLQERDRLAALGEMAAGLAHEIRNPLGAIKATAQFLEEPGQSSETTSEFLRIIVDEVDRLNRVVESFLDFARPSAGDPSPTSVNDAVAATMQLMRAECDAVGVDWHMELARDLPDVRIDVEQLRQVLINIVRNATQAMQEGGSLRVRTRAFFSHAENRFGSDHRPWAEIQIEDDGGGIPQKLLDSIFVPFVTTKPKGTGLGLAISHRIVTAAGGHLEVDSDEGAGTTFLLRLPPTTHRESELPAP